MSLHSRTSSAVPALAFAGAFAASLLGAAPSAQATLTLFTGIEGGNQGTSNVQFNTCGISGPATTVQGCLNTDTSFLVNFTGTENLFTPAVGQARVEGSDGGFTSLVIAPNDPTDTFTKLGFGGFG